MDLRSCISVFSICIFISGFGYSSGQNTTDEGNVTMTSSTPEPVTASNSTTGQNVTAADEENVNITSSAPEPVTASNSTTGIKNMTMLRSTFTPESSPSTESANSSAVGNITDSAVTEEINQQPNPKVTDRTVPPPLERDLLIIILSLTTAAGFLLWILTLIIVCSVCCYKHCTVCSSDKTSPLSDAPHVAPPSTPAPRPVKQARHDEVDEDPYARPQKKGPQKQPLDEIYGFDLPPPRPNSEACVSEADTDGVSDSNQVFFEEENKQKPAISGNPNKTIEPNDAATTSEKSPALHYTNGLKAAKALALHNNPLFIKQEEAINKDRDVRVYEEDKVYSEVEVD